MTLSEKVCSERKSWFVVIELTRNRLVMPASPPVRAYFERAFCPSHRPGGLHHSTTYRIGASSACRARDPKWVSNSKI